MALPRDPIDDPLPHLRRCWQQDCDIDPMILRMRVLRRQGAFPQAECLEEELQPLI